MAEAALPSELPSPIDLARVLRAGVRTPESLAVTGPIREALKRALEDISQGSVTITTGEPPRVWGSNVQFLDYADAGAQGLRPVMRINEGALWWGVYFWGGQRDAENLSTGFRELQLAPSEWHLEHGTGGPEIPSVVWPGGGFFRAFKSLRPDQLEEMATLNGLVSDIAADLWWWQQRLDLVKSVASFVRSAPDRVLP